MFLGTTTAPIRAFIARQITEQKPAVIWEPCAGNFAVPQVAFGAHPSVKVISGDVSEYSVILGWGLVGKDMGICYSDKALDLWPFLSSFRGPEHLAAAVIAIAEVGKFVGREHVAYYRSILEDFAKRGPKYINDLVKKVLLVRGRFGDFEFRPQDCLRVPDQVAPGEWCWFDPPYTKGSYESGLGHLGDFFEMGEAAVPYDVIDEAGRLRVLRALRDKGATVWYPPENDIDEPGFHKVFNFQRAAARQYQVYVTSPDTSTMYGRAGNMPEEQRRLEVHWPDTELRADSKAALIPTGAKLANHYRLLWTKKAVPHAQGPSWALTIDGRVTAVVIIMAAGASGASIGDHAFVASDVACTWSRYKRLGKLVLMCILTDEFLGTVRDESMQDYHGFVTVACTNAPVSMKYRGLFDLAKRNEGSPGGHKYTLTYRGTKMIADTVQAAYVEWHKRYGLMLKEEAT